MENFLSTFKEKLKIPRNLAIFTGVIGLIIGLILAWGVFPVKWKDASAEHLRQDERVVYLRNAINAYTMTGREKEAQLAWNSLGSKALDTLEDLNETPGYLFTEQIQRFTTAVDVTAPIQPVTEDANKNVRDDGTVIGLRPVDEIEPEKTKGKGLFWLGIGLLIFLVAGLYLVYRFFFKNKGVELPFKIKLPQRKPAPSPYASPRPAATPVKREPVVKQVVDNNPEEEMEKPTLNLSGLFGLGASAKTQESEEASSAMPPQTAAKPVAQFMTTYMLGDDMYDESFTFDAPNGEFLGECGVSSSDIIGVGEPKKVSAFDIWLFDKNDIQTVTKVIMSKHAYQDPATRQRLEIRGEPIKADEGKQFVLETATLRLEAKLVNFRYGDLPLPQDSYFQRATMELAIYRK